MYSLRYIKLEVLKTYIETNLANGFIKLSKFFANALILLIKKLDSSLYLYFNYQDLLT